MKKTDEKKQSTDIRRIILTVAGNLMIQKGVKETSLKDIANEVGISKGTLYYYYSAKEDIIYDIANEHLEQITNELLSWIDHIQGDVDPQQVLKLVIEKIVSAETRGKLHLYLISDACINNNSLKQRFQEKYDQWRETMQYGLKKIYKNKDKDYGVMADFIIAALDGLIIQRMISSKEIQTETIASLLSNME